MQSTNPRTEDPDNDPLDTMVMLAEEQQISLILVWQQVEMYGGTPC